MNKGGSFLNFILGGLQMQQYQWQVLEKVYQEALPKNQMAMEYLQKICQPLGIEIKWILNQILKSSVTLNFHPDRLSGSGKTVLEGMMETGLYCGQFQTGTTNGGLGTSAGSPRRAWEDSLFHGLYPEEALDRPKYGALNVFHYLDGASMRFGSCFFSLKEKVLPRCTFCCGDSSLEPTALCTTDTFACIAAQLLLQAEQKKQLLNQCVATQREAMALLLFPNRELRHLGRNLDFPIEVHVHGNISLADDVEALYMDASYQNTYFEHLAKDLCKKYRIQLGWIPIRQLKAEEIPPLFREESVRPLAEKVICLFDGQDSYLDAERIGRAARNSQEYPERWIEFGTEETVFRLFKQLWHTVGFFG